MERWKPIPGTKERLYVSDYGRVKSFLRNKTEGNILKPTNSSMANEAKKIAIISTEISTGKERRFGSISDAEMYFHSKHISAVLNGKRKQTAGQVFRREVIQQ